MTIKMILALWLAASGGGVIGFVMAAILHVGKDGEPHE